MSANAAAKKQKPLKRHPSKLKKMSAYMILTLILISIVAVLFASAVLDHHRFLQDRCRHQMPPPPNGGPASGC